MMENLLYSLLITIATLVTPHYLDPCVCVCVCVCVRACIEWFYWSHMSVIISVFIFVLSIPLCFKV
jgi:hypothetical protein